MRVPAQVDQALLQFLFLQRLKLVEDGKQHHRRNLRQGHKQHDESAPGHQPPLPRPHAQHVIDDFHHDAGKHQADQKSLHLVPQPRAQLLIR
jgi:hypothetical protein